MRYHMYLMVNCNKREVPKIRERRLLRYTQMIVNLHVATQEITNNGFEQRISYHPPFLNFPTVT